MLARRPNLLLDTLEKLLAAPAIDLRSTLTYACDLMADAFDAAKVDAFLHDPARNSLVALGASNQPLSVKQHALGLDVLQIANGGRAVQVYLTGKPFRNVRVDDDPEELRGIREGLGIKSTLGVPLDAADTRRGVIMLAALEHDFFTEEDQRFLLIVARWVGMAIHRAELAAELGQNAREQGRRAAADELVTTLAHDLRNLVSPVTLRVDLLRRRAQAQGRSADVEDAQRARRGLDRLGRLVGSLLDVARIDQGLFHIDAEPVDLAPLVRQAAATAQTPDVRVEVGTPDELVALVDRERLEQAVENVLANAVRFSPKGATVRLRVFRDPGDHVNIEVEDQGPGISPEARARLFTRFGRGNGSSGLGLGLYFAREILRAHRGDIAIESSAGKGARVTLRFPCGRVD